MNSFGQYFSRETFHNSRTYIESYDSPINTKMPTEFPYCGHYKDSSAQPNVFTKGFVIKEIGSPNEECIEKQTGILPEIGEFLREENYRKKGIYNDDIFEHSVRYSHLDNFGSQDKINQSKLTTLDTIKTEIIDHNVLKDCMDKETSSNNNSLKSPSSNSTQFHYMENKKVQKFKNEKSDFRVILNNGNHSNRSEDSAKSLLNNDYSTLRYCHFWRPNIDEKYNYEHTIEYVNQETQLCNTKSLELVNNIEHKNEYVNFIEESCDKFPYTHVLGKEMANKKITTLNSERESLQSTSDIMDGVDWSSVDCSCLEQMEKRYQNEAIRDLKLACTILNLPPDPMKWKVEQVHKWLMWTTHQCSLPLEDINFLGINGEKLCSMTEDKMRSLAPRCGDILHARLEIWRAALRKLDISSLSSKKSDPTILQMKEKLIKEETTAEFPSVYEDLPNEKEVKINESIISKMTPNHTGGIQLWQFLKELLNQPNCYEQCIRWINKERGIFKIEDSVKVAKLWGVRKNRPAMNYDKLSRSIRQYYKKGIIRKTDVSQRLVYQFVKPNV